MNHMELRSYRLESDCHSHDFAQLILPVSGSMELEVGQRLNRVKDSIGMYIAPNERHSFAGSQDNLFLVIDLREKDLFFNSKETSCSFNLTSSSKKFMDFAQHYLRDQQRDFYTDTLIQQLLLQFSSSPFDSDLKVMRAKEWIHSHLSAPIDVKQLSRHCHLSSSQLQRRFKQNTGYGLAEYWRLKKMQAAKCLLSKGQLSIESIALSLAYENLSAFSRRFSQVFGQSPSQWQKSQGFVTR